jgi:hypothetical protein
VEGDEKFVKVLAEHLERIQPTVVILPSRYDDHPIHAIVCSIGWTALLRLVSERRLSQMPRVFEVLIHYGEFPRPQGFNPSLELLPPPDLLLTARWYYLPLSQEMRQRKWEALNCYRTQKLPLTWRFLKSFVRSNEIFAEPFPLTTQPDRTGEPRSLLAGLDITQIALSAECGVREFRFEPEKGQHFVQTSQTPQGQIFIQLRGQLELPFPIRDTNCARRFARVHSIDAFEAWQNLSSEFAHSSKFASRHRCFHRLREAYFGCSTVGFDGRC